MKNALFCFLLFFALPTHSQFLPPPADWDILKNPYISQCGYIGNKTYTQVYCFEKKAKKGMCIYLQQTDGTVETVPLPEEISRTTLQITSSGPYFFIVTTKNNKHYRYAYFGVNKKKFIQITEKEIVGHDDTRPMN